MRGLSINVVIAYPTLDAICASIFTWTKLKNYRKVKIKIALSSDMVRWWISLVIESYRWRPMALLEYRISLCSSESLSSIDKSSKVGCKFETCWRGCCWNDLLWDLLFEQFRSLAMELIVDKNGQDWKTTSTLRTYSTAKVVPSEKQP